MNYRYRNWETSPMLFARRLFLAVTVYRVRRFGWRRTVAGVAVFFAVAFAAETLLEAVS